MRLALLALAAASFGIGTTEFVIMGLLPDVARDLAVSIPRAGLLVSGYAIAVTVGAPLVAIATARLPRKRTLLLLMAIFVVGNVCCALSPSYGLLMLSRVLTAFAHGSFFGIGAVVAADLVPRNRRAQAISLMFAGLTLANVLGVPAGTMLGQALGWRATFWAVVAIGVVAAAALARWVPDTAADRSVRLAQEFRTLRRPQVLLAMLISALSSVSLFSVFTYITPLLEQVSGFTPHGVSIALLLFGVGLTVGNMVGGRLADWRLMPAAIGCLVALVAVLLLFGQTQHSAIPALATLVLWGAIAFALVSPLQMRVLDQAVEAPNMASILNQGVFNLGNASGAWLGAAAIASGLHYASLPWIGAVAAATALGCAVLSLMLEQRDGAALARPV